jgi:hypothetical protein
MSSAKVAVENILESISIVGTVTVSDRKSCAAAYNAAAKFVAILSFLVVIVRTNLVVRGTHLNMCRSFSVTALY